MRKLIAGMLLVISLVTTADAHSPMGSTVPADGAVLVSAPKTLDMTFKKPARLTKVTLRDAEDNVTKLDLTGSKTFAKEHSLPVEKLKPGSQTVSWRALAKDGHAMRGKFSFEVK